MKWNIIVEDGVYLLLGTYGTYRTIPYDGSARWEGRYDNNIISFFAMMARSSVGTSRFFLVGLCCELRLPFSRLSSWVLLSLDREDVNVTAFSVRIRGLHCRFTLLLPT